MSCHPAASLQPGGPNSPGASMASMLKCVSFMSTNQPSAASFKQSPPPLESTQRSRPPAPGMIPENSVVVREALRMQLPAHLVLQSAQDRLQTAGHGYSDLKELVADLFARRASQDGEVPMETNHLEDAMMMNSPVARKAVRMGVPPHLIRPKLRAKILLSGECYPDLSELLIDLNLK